MRVSACALAGDDEEQPVTTPPRGDPPRGSARGRRVGTPVEVVGVTWLGTEVIELTYRDPAGHTDRRQLYRSDEAQLTITAPSEPMRFDAPASEFELAAEATRLQRAHLLDPFLALAVAQVSPLPHKIEAVYGEMLPRQPLRFLLADDPGAGKTIMTGLLIKELLIRADVERCLIVVPGGLLTQWHDELAEKFDLPFEMLPSGADPGDSVTARAREPLLLLARMDQLARNDGIAQRLLAVDWDLVVVDEAHRMSAHFVGDEPRESKRYKLGKRLAANARHFLLLTATPHNGKPEDFYLFMSLLDPDRFAGRPRSTTEQLDCGDLMRRMPKELLVRFDGKPLFPERRASTVTYQLSSLERVVYDAVTTYVVEEMNRAERLREGRRAVVGFALTVLQRRLASSPAASAAALTRRRERLEERYDQLVREHAANVDLAEAPWWGSIEAEDPALIEGVDEDEIDPGEQEELEETLLDAASSATTIDELRRELETLRELEALARRVVEARTDTKWQQLRQLVEDTPTFFRASGERHKLVIFTEHRDTLAYLHERLSTLLGDPDRVVYIHGRMSRRERLRAQQTFSEDPACTVLVATDAAGEGINLQCAHLVINYDLPWNPSRIEQRFGRVHRIGQEQVCYLWNLVAADTREALVHLTLLRTLEVQRRALKGRVFDVLGEALSGRQLRDLILTALREGDTAAVRATITERVDAALARAAAERASGACSPRVA